MGIKDLFKRAEEEVEPVVDDVLLRALLSGETIDRNKAMTLPAVSGAVNFITDTVGAISSNSVNFISNGVEYYLSSDSLTTEEMMQVAESISPVAVMK